MSKVITANLLATGSVVFLAPDDTWVHALDQAATFPDAPAAERGLVRAQRDQEHAVIVDPFITETGPETDGRPAMTLRDTIRAYGPTIRFSPAGSTKVA